MMKAVSFVKTDTPSKYINRLCKHFAHKVVVNYNDDKGEITFDMGTGSIFKYNDGLLLVAEADQQENLETVIDIMDRHFVRVAWQEEVKLDWKQE